MEFIGEAHFPREIQMTDYTCAPCSVFTITQFFGRRARYRKIKAALKTDVDGTSEGEIIKYLRSQKLRVAPRPDMNWKQVVHALEVGGVVLVTLDGDHYGVVHAFDAANSLVYLADPSLRRQAGRTTSIAKFKKRWDREGIIVCRRPPRRAPLWRRRRS